MGIITKNGREDFGTSDRLETRKTMTLGMVMRKLYPERDLRVQGGEHQRWALGPFKFLKENDRRGMLRT